MEKIKAYCVAPLENADDLDISLGIGGKGNRTRTKSDSVLERNSASETRKVSLLQYRMTHQVVPKLSIQGQFYNHTGPESRVWEQPDVSVSPCTL